jgi:hypothetical protein
MTEKRKRIKIVMDKTLLIAIIEATPDGESVENTFNTLLKKGLQSEGKLPNRTIPHRGRLNHETN